MIETLAKQSIRIGYLKRIARMSLNSDIMFKFYHLYANVIPEVNTNRISMNCVVSTGIFCKHVMVNEDTSV